MKIDKDEFEDVDLNNPKDMALNSHYKNFEAIVDSIYNSQGQKDLIKIVGAVLEQTSEFYIESKKALSKDEITAIFQKELIILMQKSAEIKRKNSKSFPIGLDNFIKELRNNMDDYVDALDKDVSKSRNMFAKIGISLQKGGSPEVQDSSWKIVADLFRKVKCMGLAEYFDKKNSEAKLKDVQKSVDKIAQTLKMEKGFPERDVGKFHDAAVKGSSKSSSRS